MSGDWGTGCFLSCLVPAALHPQPRLAQGSDRFATTPHFVFPKTNSFHTRTDGQGPTSASSHPPLPHHHLRGLASPLESSLQVGVGAACPFLSSCPREGMGMITTGLFGISTSQHSLPHTGRRTERKRGGPPAPWVRLGAWRAPWAEPPPVHQVEGSLSCPSEACWGQEGRLLPLGLRVCLLRGNLWAPLKWQRDD